jgi:hypothetical protein
MNFKYVVHVYMVLHFDNVRAVSMNRHSLGATRVEMELGNRGVLKGKATVFDLCAIGSHSVSFGR